MTSRNLDIDIQKERQLQGFQEPGKWYTKETAASGASSYLDIDIQRRQEQGELKADGPAMKK